MSAFDREKVDNSKHLWLIFTFIFLHLDDICSHIFAHFKLILANY